MSRKKQHKTPGASAGSTGPLGTADTTQVQSLMAQFHEIARALHKSQDQQQVEATLQPIMSVAEGTQFALLKVLSKEQSADAADVVLAVNEFSPSKEVRKEARRSLIRLQEVHVYPKWQPPAKHTALMEVIEASLASNNPPRFWKGFVTDSRDAGEVSLILLWEQGENYREVRLMGFLLDFWTEGIKDFFTEVDSKRRIEAFINDMRSQVETLSCSLAKGRSLIQESLNVNKKTGTKPRGDYYKYQSLINQLILEAPDIGEMTEEELAEEIEHAELNTHFEPPVVVTGFVDAWVSRNYTRAYSFLASSSDLLEGLTAEEWVERRQQWADTAQPAALLPGFIHEREAQKSKLWLPNPFSRGNTGTDEQKEFDASWSIELAHNDPDASLPELPKPTMFYKENKRYWFWANFTLVKEEGNWCIQSMTDEGTNIQSLSINELQARIKEDDKRVQDITKKHAPTDPDAIEYLEDVLWHMIKPIYYDDALITKLPLDETLYTDATTRAMMIGELERSIAYLERMVERFPTRKAELLLQIAALQIRLSEAYYSREDDDFSDEDDLDEEEAEDERTIIDSELSRGEHFYELAKATLEESLQLDESVTGHVLLADILIDNSDEEEFDVAEDHLEQARALTETPEDLAHIEMSEGELEMEREQYEHALRHFQQVLEYNPNYPDIWSRIGNVYHTLGNEEESIHAFQHAIELDPRYVDNYADLADIYIRSGQQAEARAVLEQGIQAVPKSSHLYVLLSATYISEDTRRAEELLDKAESLEPDSEFIPLYRSVLNSAKQQASQDKGHKGKKLKKR
jgi:tetratricopeptide (TPR) repeat protein